MVGTLCGVALQYRTDFFGIKSPIGSFIIWKIRKKNHWSFIEVSWSFVVTKFRKKTPYETSQPYIWDSFSFISPPKWTFLAFNLRPVSAYFWPLDFFIHRKWTILICYPMGSPLNLFFLCLPRNTFLSLILLAVSADFWPQRFFITLREDERMWNPYGTPIWSLRLLYLPLRKLL